MARPKKADENKQKEYQLWYHSTRTLKAKAREEGMSVTTLLNYIKGRQSAAPNLSTVETNECST